MEKIKIKIDWNLDYELTVPDIITTQNELNENFKALVDRRLKVSDFDAFHTIRVSEIEGMPWCSAKLIASRNTTPLERFKANEGRPQESYSKVGTRMHAERLIKTGGVSEPKDFARMTKELKSEKLTTIRDTFKKASPQLKELTKKPTLVHVAEKFTESPELAEEFRRIVYETKAFEWANSLNLETYFRVMVKSSQFLEEWYKGFLNDGEIFGSLGEVTFMAPYHNYVISGHPDHVYLHRGRVLGVLEYKTKAGKIPEYLLNDEPWALQRAGYRFLLNYVFGRKDFPIIQYAKRQTPPYTPKFAVEGKDSFLFTQYVDRAIEILEGKTQPETGDGCDICDCRSKCKYKY